MPEQTDDDDFPYDLEVELDTLTEQLQQAEGDPQVYCPFCGEPIEEEF